MDNGNRIYHITVCLVILFLAAFPLASQELDAEAAVEKDEVFVGETFVYQIKVNGSEAPEQPVLQGFDDFNVVFLGGSNNSSDITMSINGKTTRTINRSYIF